jgi:predicted ATPase/class 3 adenylate cyclase
MHSALAYLPVDRVQALACGYEIPAHASGAALFTDISGFTPLTNALADQLGPRRGAEEATRQLNMVYESLIGEVHRLGGVVIGFSGDGMLSWYEVGEGESQRDAARRAVASGLAMQQMMARFASIAVGSVSISLTMKAAIAAGTARRAVAGDPQIQRIDAIGGAAIDAVGWAEQRCNRGEVVLAGAAIDLLSGDVRIKERRVEAQGEVAVVEEIDAAIRALHDDYLSPYASVLAGTIEPEPELARSWLLPGIYARLQAGQERFLAELRPATALFLRFGGLDFDNDPDAGTLLDTYVRWVQRVLAEREGALIQLTTGDKGSYLYAVFGAPVSHEDDVARAAGAALALIEPPASLPFRPEVQIGIAQGRMRVGAYGSQTRRTYGVQGPAVNLAARLMSAAQPGQVLVEAATGNLMATQFRLEPLPPLTVKGRSTPVSVFALAGAGATRTQPVTHRTHLVGREQELAELLSLLAPTQQGTGAVIGVEGPAGVGKSHLVAEFCRQARQQGVDVLVGACHSMSHAIAYAALRPIARQLLGLPALKVDADDVEVERVRAVLAAWNPDWLLRMPLLGETLGLPIADNALTAGLEPRLRQEALTSLFVDIVQIRCQEQAIILGVEDAHWLDEASQALIAALARMANTARVLLLLVQRPPADGEQDWTQRMLATSGVRWLTLGELRGDSVADLVRRRMGGDVSSLATAVIEARSQGNPFFTEELVDTLREAGRLHLRNGVWDLSAQLIDALRDANCLVQEQGEWRLAANAPLAAADLGLPDSVHGVVLSRIDRLPERVLLTLKVASVIGRVFDLDLLARVHPSQPSHVDLQSQLDELRLRDLARASGEAGETTFLFKHNITQEVVYQTLLEVQQQELHGAVGEAIEAVNPEDVERLAFHFCATNLVDAEPRRKALLYLERAAHKTERDYANETALGYYRRALGLEQRWQWVQASVRLLHVLGRREEEWTALARLEQNPDTPPDEVARLKGRYYEAIGQYEEAMTVLAKALAFSKIREDRQGEVQAVLQMAAVVGKQGDYQKEAAHYRTALALAGDSERYLGERVSVLYGLAVTARQQGEFEAASDHAQAALALAQSAHDLPQEARILTLLGSVARMLRKFDEAAAYTEAALAIRRQIGDRAGVGASLLTLAQVVSEGSGDHARARRLLMEALAIQQAVDNRWSQAVIWNDLGIDYLLVADFAQSAASLRTALALCREIGATAVQAHVLCNLGQAVRELGDPHQALAMLREGMTIAVELGDKLMMSQYQTELAITARQLRDWEAAMNHARYSIGLLNELDLQVMMTADLGTLALCNLALGNTAEAVTYANATLEILDGCNGEGPDYPHRDYAICALILYTSAEMTAADAALAKAKQILADQAERVSDAHMRRMFLSFHSRMIQAAEDVARTRSNVSSPTQSSMSAS